MSGLVLASPSVLTRALLACYAMSIAIHLASIALSTLLPFHVVALGGSRTQIGLVFSTTTIVSMVIRPVVGDWIDRFGARRVILPGIAALALTSVALHFAGTPEMVLAVSPASVSPTRVSDRVGRAQVALPAMVVTALAYVTLAFPPTTASLMLGTLSAAWDLGVVIGSALIGFVANRASFGAAFAVAGTTTLLGAVTFLLAERQEPRRTLAPVGEVYSVRPPSR